MTGSPDNTILLGGVVSEREKKLDQEVSDLSLVRQIPSSVVVSLPGLNRGGYFPFAGNVTGSIATPTNGLAAVTPSQPLRLRGGRVTMMVTNQLEASSPGVLGVYDGATNTLLATLVGHSSTQSASTLLASELEFDLREGFSATGPYYIAGTQNIGGGIIHVSGLLYGVISSG